MGAHNDAEDELSPPGSPSDAGSHQLGLQDYEQLEPREEFHEFRFPFQLLPDLRAHVNSFTQLNVPAKSSSFSIDSILKRENV